jgi:hypothetical protein
VSTVTGSPGAYAQALQGCWELTRREDHSESGELKEDPGLGPDPLGLLIYHPSGHFSAQFMRRDRSPEAAPAPDLGRSGHNNTRSVGGYDAYFGRYTVDEEAHTVTQTLEGALAPDNVGVVVTRKMEVEGDVLTLRLPTTDANGDSIVRTLQWRRCRPQDPGQKRKPFGSGLTTGS